VTVIIFYAFAGLEMIGEEIEDPFGNDVNDL
jgi:ion channel-forming bestrophin family protein